MMVVDEDLRDATRDSLTRVDVEKLVRSVRVALGAEDAGDEKLCLRELLPEHPHKWDGAALSHEGRGLLEVGLGRTLERVLEPGG